MDFWGFIKYFLVDTSARDGYSPAISGRRDLSKSGKGPPQKGLLIVLPKRAM